jgi:PIN domain nuclease of toxin-antitoxin system
MRLLLDTHAFLWFVMGDGRLSSVARAAIEDDANEKFVSAGSAWEIAIKVSLGKLDLKTPYAALLPREIANNGFSYLTVEVSHTTLVASLPFHHRDPFDRLLIAQALAEGMSIVSADAAIEPCGVARVW